MIDKKTRNTIEKGIRCILCKGDMQYVSETKKGLITMKCPTCEKKNGITNEIKLKVKERLSRSVKEK